jgi:hypothetical protein
MLHCLVLYLDGQWRNLERRFFVGGSAHDAPSYFLLRLLSAYRRSPTAFLAMGVLLLLTFLDYASGSFSSPLNHMLFAWWDRTVRTGSSYHRFSWP